MNPNTWQLICVTCYFLIIGTDKKFNHTNSAIHSLVHSRSLFTSTGDYASTQQTVVLRIWVTCPHMSTSAGSRLPYMVFVVAKVIDPKPFNTCGPSEDPLCHDGHVRQEVKGSRECPEALGAKMFANFDHWLKRITCWCVISLTWRYMGLYVFNWPISVQLIERIHL